MPQLAKALGMPPHWVYHQSKHGTVVVQREAQPRLSLFPDCPETLAALRPLRAGHRRALRYGAPPGSAWPAGALPVGRPAA